MRVPHGAGVGGTHGIDCHRRPGRRATRPRSLRRAGDTRSSAEVGRVIVGQRELVRQTVTALLANSHVLLEGVPGLGKTMLVRTIADVIDCAFNRIQFTPDLMPADITGTNILVEEDGRRIFRFQSGPDLRQPRPGRRDQPRHAEDPVVACSRRCRSTR